jgi:hypothetical protein
MNVSVTTRKRLGRPDFVCFNKRFIPAGYWREGNHACVKVIYLCPMLGLFHI